MRTTILALLSSLLLLSCSKENSDNNSSATYIRAKMDGKDITFNSMSMATKMVVSGSTMLSVHGNVAAGAIEGINFSISHSGNITTGTYREDDTSNDYIVAAVYGKTQNDVWAAGMSATPAHPFTITITEISATRVKGSFSGGVYSNNGMGSSEKVFTNGEFNVAIQQ